MQEQLVLKCGGSTLEQLPSSFYEEVAALQRQGWPPVLVHGGGPLINQMLERLQVASRFADGLRVTDEAALEVVEMVLCGKVNKALVTSIAQAGGQALGLSGIDAGLLQAVVLDERLGRVGRVSAVNIDLLTDLLRLGLIPVIASLGATAAGEHLNINADTAAAAVAGAFPYARLILLTDVEGVYIERNGEKEVVNRLFAEEVTGYIEEGQIQGGMLPKVQAALDCLAKDVREVVILSGRTPYALSRYLDGEPVGTTFARGVA